MTSARSPSSRISLSMTTSPTVSKPWAITTLSASLSMTSWPGFRSSMSILGLTLTRILRPPVKTSAVPSSQADRKTPKPDGGCASRSTSSFSATIWSRPRAACRQAVVLPGDTGKAGLSLTQPLFQQPRLHRRVRQPAPQRGNFLLEEGDLRGQDLDLVIVSSGSGAVITGGHAPHPFRELTYPDPTYPGCIRNLARAPTMQSGVTIRIRRGPVGASPSAPGSAGVTPVHRPVPGS